KPLGNSREALFFQYGWTRTAQRVRADDEPGRSVGGSLKNYFDACITSGSSTTLRIFRAAVPATGAGAGAGFFKATACWRASFAAPPGCCDIEDSTMDFMAASPASISPRSVEGVLARSESALPAAFFWPVTVQTTRVPAPSGERVETRSLTQSRMGRS